MGGRWPSWVVQRHGNTANKAAKGDVLRVDHAQTQSAGKEGVAGSPGVCSEPTAPPFLPERWRLHLADVCRELTMYFIV